MVNGNVWSVPAEIPTMARFSPMSAEAAVVIVIFCVLVAGLLSFSAAAWSFSRHDGEDDVLAGLVLRHQLRHVGGVLHRRTVHVLDHVSGVQ